MLQSLCHVFLKEFHLFWGLMFTQLSNNSFHVVEKNEKFCERHKNGNARALRAKVLFFIVKYAHKMTLWRFVAVVIAFGNSDKLTTCLYEFVLSLIKSILKLNFHCTSSLSRCAWLKFDCLNRWHDIIGVREKFCWGGGGGAEHNLPEWNFLVTDAQDDFFVK